MIFLIVALCIVIVAGYFFLQRKKKQTTPSMFVSTQGQSQERIGKLGLDRPSEDASSILDASQLVFPKEKRNYENIEFKADPESEWVITIELVKDGVFRKDDLWALFDKDWRTQFDSAQVYGYSAEGRWGYVIAGGTPDLYTKVQLGINLQDVYNEDIPDYEVEKLERYLVELNRRVASYPVSIKVTPIEPVEVAIAKAQQIVELYNEFNHDAIIVLKSESPFKGAVAWDALLATGLQWGDGDLFHWNNHDSDYGHDQHFSVWTSTSPGYFFPENIRKMLFTNLIFGFSIPRSADPINIFEAMLNTVKYCKKRLGGIVLDRNGKPLNEQAERKYIADIVNNMRSKGVIPGSVEALQQY